VVITQELFMSVLSLDTPFKKPIPREAEALLAGFAVFVFLLAVAKVPEHFDLPTEAPNDAFDVASPDADPVQRRQHY
jgi:hypothetical protein